MPVILKVQDVEAWVDPRTSDVLKMLAPYPDDLMEACTVSSMVNSHRNNSPECVARLNIS